jgi:DMSO/TMAO reductase YedYZ molybdopterin-dependent catalytic subunit
MPPLVENAKDRELPPGQVPIKQLLRWGKNHPTIGGPVPKIDLKLWLLIVDGEVEKPPKAQMERLSKASNDQINQRFSLC